MALTGVKGHDVEAARVPPHCARGVEALADENYVDQSSCPAIPVRREPQHTAAPSAHIALLHNQESADGPSFTSRVVTRHHDSALREEEGTTWQAATAVLGAGRSPHAPTAFSYRKQPRTPTTEVDGDVPTASNGPQRPTQPSNRPQHVPTGTTASVARTLDRIGTTSLSPYELRAPQRIRLPSHLMRAIARGRLPVFLDKHHHRCASRLATTAAARERVLSGACPMARTSNGWIPVASDNQRLGRLHATSHGSGH